MNQKIYQLSGRLAQLLLLLALASSLVFASPRNVILMIGDGMGPDVVTAAGAYKYGTDYFKFGGKEKLTLETLSKHYYMTTFSASGKGYDYTWNNGDTAYVKNGATDSAAAATAMATGVKTNDGYVSVDTDKKPVEIITEYARKMGKKTGVVTSVYFYDATPAGFSAHNGGRGNAKEISQEMFNVTQPDVLMGTGGLGNTPLETAFKNISKENWDGVLAGKTGYTYMESRADFQQLITKPAPGRILGLVHGDSPLKPRNADGKSADPNQPTLKEMTQATLSTLNNPAGFIVMIEGGNIDKIAHGNNLDGTIGEVLAFDEAIAATIDWIAQNGGWEQNLLIITADHDTGYLNDVQPTEANKLPLVKWGNDGKGWGGHTNRIVDLYTMGEGSELFDKYAKKNTDFLLGTVQVVDNTDIFKVMKASIPVK